MTFRVSRTPRLDQMRVPCPQCGRATIGLYPMPDNPAEEGCACCAEPSLVQMMAHFHHEVQRHG